MKKTLAILTACGLAASTFAQGTVIWASPTTAMVAQTNTTSYSSFETSSGSPAVQTTGLAGGNSGTGLGLLYYELLTTSGSSTAPTSLSQFGSTLSSQWVDTGLTMTNTAANNGRITALGSENSQNASTVNWANGATQGFMLVGWSANLGTTWAAALANLNNWATFSQSLSGTAWFGISSTAVATIGNANPGIALFGTTSGTQIDGSVATGTPLQLRPIFVSPVPEPATMALAGLGGLSLLAFRRRK